MGENWISFQGLLQLWAAALLLALGLEHLRKLDLQRPRSVLPLAALPALLWMQPALSHLALQCQIALLGTAPGQFFQHAFDLPLS
jgi:hypothetical protein